MGDNIGNDHAVYDGCGSRWDNSQTAPVASFEVNDLGLYDTTGYVWEWVQDCFHNDFKNAPSNGNAWEEKDKGNCGFRVLRGGSSFYYAAHLRSATRIRTQPVSRNEDISFRLAQDLN